MKKFPLFLISLFFTLAFITSTFPEQPVQPNSNQRVKIALEELLEVDFIGEPTYSFMDFNKDGEWDVIWFNQTINITRVGTGLLLMRGALEISAIDNVSRAVTNFMTGGDGPVGLLNVSSIGPLTISKWLKRPGVLDRYDEVNISWTPALSPLYSNYTISSETYEGITKRINFSLGYYYVQGSIHYGSFLSEGKLAGSITPTLNTLVVNNTNDRHIGEQYTWNYTVFSASPYSFYPRLALGIEGYYNSSITLNITNLDGFIVVKPLINQSLQLNETLSGYPFSIPFIPANLSSEIVFQALPQNMMYAQLVSRILGGYVSTSVFNDSNGFLGYNLVLNYTQIISETRFANRYLNYTTIYDNYLGILYSRTLFFDYESFDVGYHYFSSDKYYLELDSNKTPQPNWRTVFQVNRTQYPPPLPSTTSTSSSSNSVPSSSSQPSSSVSVSSSSSGSSSSSTSSDSSPSTSIPDTSTTQSTTTSSLTTTTSSAPDPFFNDTTTFEGNLSTSSPSITTSRAEFILGFLGLIIVFVRRKK